VAFETYDRWSVRRRFLLGALLVAAVSLLQLIQLGFGGFSGSFWPLAYLWAICGWSGLGPRVTSAVAIFALGVWLDSLTGAPLGTWPLIGLASHGLTLLSDNFLVTLDLGPLGACALTACFMLVMMMLWGLLRDHQWHILSMLPATIGAVALYPLFAPLFEMAEDEA
jgi:hypothetical protein